MSSTSCLSFSRTTRTLRRTGYMNPPRHSRAFLQSVNCGGMDFEGNGKFPHATAVAQKTTNELLLVNTAAVRSRMRSRSNSAIPANTVMIIFPSTPPVVHWLAIHSSLSFSSFRAMVWSSGSPVTNGASRSSGSGRKWPKRKGPSCDDSVFTVFDFLLLPQEPKDVHVSERSFKRLSDRISSFRRHPCFHRLMHGSLYTDTAAGCRTFKAAQLSFGQADRQHLQMLACCHDGILSLSIYEHNCQTKYGVLIKRILNAPSPFCFRHPAGSDQAGAGGDRLRRTCALHRGARLRHGAAQRLAGPGARGLRHHTRLRSERNGGGPDAVSVHRRYRPGDGAGVCRRAAGVHDRTGRHHHHTMRRACILLRAHSGGSCGGGAANGRLQPSFSRGDESRHRRPDRRVALCANRDSGGKPAGGTCAGRSHSGDRQHGHRRTPSYLREAGRGRSDGAGRAAFTKKTRPRHGAPARELRTGLRPHLCGAAGYCRAGRR